MTLPSPVTIAAGGEALQLDLDAAQSVAFPSCVQSGFEGFTATPTFELSAVQLAAEPTNSGNGLALGLTGQITSIADGGATFDLTSIDGLSWPILSNGSTVYQGAAGAAALLQGQIVNVVLRAGIFDRDAPGDQGSIRLHARIRPNANGHGHASGVRA